MQRDNLDTKSYVFRVGRTIKKLIEVQKAQ
jgi:hypothetical protein